MDGSAEEYRRTRGFLASLQEGSGARSASGISARPRSDNANKAYPSGRTPAPHPCASVRWAVRRVGSAASARPATRGMRPAAAIQVGRGLLQRGVEPKRPGVHADVSRRQATAPRRALSPRPRRSPARPPRAGIGSCRGRNTRPSCPTGRHGSRVPRFPLPAT